MRTLILATLAASASARRSLFLHDHDAQAAVAAQRAVSQPQLSDDQLELALKLGVDPRAVEADGSQLVTLAHKKAAAGQQADGGPFNAPVRVELYYEALCPGCQDFILNTLAPAYADPEIAAITQLVMVPYGNTRQSGDNYVCQHGPDECTSDVYGLCLLDKLGGIGTPAATSAAFDFFVCMEQNSGSPASGAGCFDANLPAAGFAWADVLSCAEDKAASDAVQALGATATPDHQYVPWVVVDGNQLENPDPLLHIICTTYTGKLPAACADSKPHMVEELSAYQPRMEAEGRGVCYAGQEYLSEMPSTMRKL